MQKHEFSTVSGGWFLRTRFFIIAGIFWTFFKTKTSWIYSSNLSRIVSQKVFFWPFWNGLKNSLWMMTKHPYLKKNGWNSFLKNRNETKMMAKLVWTSRAPLGPTVGKTVGGWTSQDENPSGGTLSTFKFLGEIFVHQLFFASCLDWIWSRWCFFVSMRCDVFGVQVQVVVSKPFVSFHSEI